VHSRITRPSEVTQERDTRVPTPDLQELWFRTLQYDWSSLVVVPTHWRCSARRIAEALGEMAALQRGMPIPEVVASESAMGGPGGITALVVREADAVASRHRQPWAGRNAVYAVEPIVSNPAGIAAVLAADAAILCVKLGETRLEEARRTVDLIGRERFIGCVLEK